MSAWCAIAVSPVVGVAAGAWAAARASHLGLGLLGLAALLGALSAALSAGSWLLFSAADWAQPLALSTLFGALGGVGGAVGVGALLRASD